MQLVSDDREPQEIDNTFINIFLPHLISKELQGFLLVICEETLKYCMLVNGIFTPF